MTLLEEKLGYGFRDPALLLKALTHPSYAGEHHTGHYQRLEFLGDAVLELSISRILYFAMPENNEGILTRTRQELVREETLYRIACGLALGKEIRLSGGEDRSGGRDKPSILSDVMEAVIAAVYLDGGFEAAFGLVERLWGDLIGPGAVGYTLDAKTTLQERLQSRGEIPVYEMLGCTGPAHDPRFTFRVLSGPEELGRGTGRSKQSAQQEAARAALKQIGE